LVSVRSFIALPNRRHLRLMGVWNLTAAAIVKPLQPLYFLPF
jgi:hypothetical protein